MMKSMQTKKVNYSLQPSNLTDNSQAYTGYTYISPDTYNAFLQQNNNKKPVYLKVLNYVFYCKEAPQFRDDQIGLGKLARQFLKVSLTEKIQVSLFQFQESQEFRLSQISLEVDIVQLISGRLEVEDKELEKLVRGQFKDVVFQPGHIFLVEYFGDVLSIKCSSTQVMSLGVKDEMQTQNQPGIIVEETDIEFSAQTRPNFKLKSSSNKVQNIFRADFKFEEMGIGGLDKELSNIFRRAFASRRFPPSVLEKYGISHVKGVLLHGPPGTGKTLIARELGKALRAKEPKIVNGPEIMSKYVGQAEENIRKLFEEAINDQKVLGDQSQLHIIIFDEIDSICRQRGTINSGTGVHDTMVNQLLSMIDGVDALNNVLVIGMTNRKDLIDEAVLRPGRFEVHIEVTLPDENGRQQIFKIHTKKIFSNNLVAPDVDIKRLAELTKNYTGAEIEAVVKSATSFAFNKNNDIMNFQKQQIVNEQIKIEMNDFVQALEEVKPQFGVDTDKFEILVRNSIYNYGQNFQKILHHLESSIQQVKRGKSSQLHSILLEGEQGTGKTAIAAWTALKCQFPFVKLISPENFVGFTESGKINLMVKIFDDAYKSPLSCVVLDNIERLIEYIDLGPRFSNPILQALLVLIKKVPKNPENRLLVIGTSSCAKILKDVEIIQCFNLLINVPQLTQPSEIATILREYKVNESEVQKIAKSIPKISVKRLIMVLDMASNSDQQVTYEEFMNCYEASCAGDML